MNRPAPDSAEVPQLRVRFLSVVSKLTGVNLLVASLALVTSPILAHALGPSGRGELAAIFTLLTLAPWISDLGLAAFLARERARRADLGLLLGSVIPIAFVVSLIGPIAAVPLADLIGRGREVVTLFIVIGLVILPVTVFIQTLYGVVLGDERWRVIMLNRILAAGIPAVAIVLLAVSGHVSVATVSVSYLAASTLGSAPLLVALRHSRPWRLRWSVSKRAVAFGVRSWLATIAVVANARLDQLLMAGLVSSRQLGLYALAVTIASASGALIGAVSTALFPRVAAGEGALAARASRMTTLFVLVVSMVIAATSPQLIPLVFGSAFSPAVPMLLILLGASVLAVAGQVLTTAVTAGGAPETAARAQALGLVVTVPGLIVVLPAAGGIGAAWVSVAAYGVTLLVLLSASVRLFGLPSRDFLIAKPDDFRWLRARLARGRTAPVTPI